MLIKAWTLKRELKQQQFWATHVNRKWTFCTLGPWLWSNYQANHLHESNDTKQYKFGSIKGYSKVGWVWLSGWTLSWIVTDFSTTCAVVIFRVNWSQHHQSLSTTTALSGLRSPGRSNSTYFWNDSWVQTFHSIKGYWKGNGLTSGWCALLKNTLNTY